MFNKVLYYFEWNQFSEKSMATKIHNRIYKDNNSIQLHVVFKKQRLIYASWAWWDQIAAHTGHNLLCV